MDLIEIKDWVKRQIGPAVPHIKWLIAEVERLQPYESAVKHDAQYQKAYDDGKSFERQLLSEADNFEAKRLRRLAAICGLGLGNESEEMILGCARAIRALSSPPPDSAHAGVCEWKPIDTAPKDKRVLLIGEYWSDSQGTMPEPLIGMWNPHLDRWEAAWMCWFGIRPTHWMPLPTAPISVKQ